MRLHFWNNRGVIYPSKLELLSVKKYFFFLSKRMSLNVWCLGGYFTLCFSSTKSALPPPHVFTFFPFIIPFLIKMKKWKEGNVEKDGERAEGLGVGTSIFYRDLHESSKWRTIKAKEKASWAADMASAEVVVVWKCSTGLVHMQLEGKLRSWDGGWGGGGWRYHGKTGEVEEWVGGGGLQNKEMGWMLAVWRVQLGVADALVRHLKGLWRTVRMSRAVLRLTQFMVNAEKRKGVFLLSGQFHVYLQCPDT